MHNSSSMPVAVVTGAGRGLGRAEALRFAAGGHAVAVNDLTADGVREVAGEIEALGGEALEHVADISEEDGANGLIAATLARFGRIDAVVNNAGITADRMIFNLQDSEWDAVLAVNLTGTFRVSRAAARHWRGVAKQSGRPVHACIVNTTSRAGLFGNAGQANYGSAKAGVAAMTLILARELRRYGVRCNAVAPRAYTPMMHKSFGAFRPEELSEWSPEAVARVVTYMGSRQSAPMTGQVLIVQGRHVTLTETWHEVASVELPAGDDEPDISALFNERPAEIGEFEVAADMPLQEGAG